MPYARADRRNGHNGPIAKEEAVLVCLQKASLPRRILRMSRDRHEPKTTALEMSIEKVLHMHANHTCHWNTGNASPEAVINKYLCRPYDSIRLLPLQEIDQYRNNVDVSIEEYVSTRNDLSQWLYEALSHETAYKIIARRKPEKEVDTNSLRGASIDYHIIPLPDHLRPVDHGR